jgi:hypothetical protein
MIIMMTPYRNAIFKKLPSCLKPKNTTTVVIIGENVNSVANQRRRVPLKNRSISLR